MYKRVHGNEKMNLPSAFGKCPGSLHFTLLHKPVHIRGYSMFMFKTFVLLM